MTDPLDLVVSLTGIDDTFAQSIHAMTTYNAATILEGKRFVDMSGVSAAGRPVLDFSKFDAVVDAG